MSTNIIIKFQLSGYHNWAGAPEEYKHLRENHYHDFHFEIEVPITELDREIEFDDLRCQIVDVIKTMYPNEEMIHGVNSNHAYKFKYYKYEFGSASCEMLCAFIKKGIEEQLKVPIYSIKVSEDGENGGILRN